MSGEKVFVNVPESFIMVFSGDKYLKDGPEYLQLIVEEIQDHLDLEGIEDITLLDSNQKPIFSVEIAYPFEEQQKRCMACLLLGLFLTIQPGQINKVELTLVRKVQTEVIPDPDQAANPDLTFHDTEK